MYRLGKVFSAAVFLATLLAFSSNAFAGGTCGNGILDVGEQCDHGGSGSDCCSVDCTVLPECGCCEFSYGVNSSSPRTVLPQCYLSTSTSCEGMFFADSMCGINGCEPIAVCGNGVREGLEQCDDSSPCCDQKSCQFKSFGVTCEEDGNLCTSDQCDGKGNCFHQPADPLPEFCGCCEYLPSVVGGRFAGECQTSDSSSCRGTFYSNAVCTEGGCVGPVCGNGILETGEDCDPGGSDSTDCCDVATCKFQQIGTTCTDDTNACTSDICNANGQCTHPANNDPCDDGLYCTANDVCSNGACVPGAPRDCGASNTCATANCNEDTNQCEVTPDLGQNGQPCDDSNACTSNTTCSSGVCGGGSSLNCDDSNTCTVDSCNTMTGCVNTVSVESPACGSCEDGVDNDADDATDYGDCGCNLLCESYEYAIVGTRNNARRTVYLGGDVQVETRDITGGVGYTSRASACAERQFVVIADASVDGAVAARRNTKFGTGTGMFFGFFAGFPSPPNPVVPPAQIVTTGVPPFVGPRVQCSDGVTACTTDMDCPVGFVCNPLLLSDPANVFPAGYVDLTGAHEEYVDCGTAISSLIPDFTTLFNLPPTVQLGNFVHADGGAPIVVSGPGPHVLRMSRFRVKGKSTLQISGDANSVVIIQVERGFSVSQTGAVELAGGLRPDKVIWVVDRNGRAYVGSGEDADPDAIGDSAFAGTILAPNRTIVIGKRSEIDGALLGRRVQLNGEVVLGHYPFTGIAP